MPYEWTGNIYKGRRNQQIQIALPYLGILFAIDTFTKTTTLYAAFLGKKTKSWYRRKWRKPRDDMVIYHVNNQLEVTIPSKSPLWTMRKKDNQYYIQPGFLILFRIFSRIYGVLGRHNSLWHFIKIYTDINNIENVNMNQIEIICTSIDKTKDIVINAINNNVYCTLYARNNCPELLKINECCTEFKPLKEMVWIYTEKKSETYRSLFSYLFNKIPFDLARLIIFFTIGDGRNELKVSVIDNSFMVLTMLLIHSSRRERMWLWTEWSMRRHHYRWINNLTNYIMASRDCSDFPLHWNDTDSD